jgi:hypothetical protein
MKFGKYWNTQIEKLPKKLQSKTLFYKKWKKTNTNNENIIYELTNECNIVNDTIIENINNKSKLFCFTKKKLFNMNQLYEYVMLNKLTLYKICKKLDKKFNSNQYKIWLQKHYTDFSFNCGIYYTKLSLENNKYSDLTCPVCLDELNENVPSIITNCGHIICYSCVLSMYNITEKNRGRISTLINNENLCNKNKNCPICRSSFFVNNIHSINIYPSKFKYILNEIDH